ncbi:MAG: family 10 glycosylhydrolase, partial [Armatimonadetes bacterium]|nr:family 10 glycosylhydrolase [Armatimonadota bacterium]
TNTLKKPGGEGGVLTYSDNVFKLLRDAGVGCGTIRDEDVESGGLAGRKLVIFGYSPDMSDAEVTAAEQFVAAGGKLIVFYSATTRMLNLLGIKYGNTIVSEEGTQLYGLRFDAPGVDGMPAAVAQRSWRTVVPVPVDPQAKVIGWWRGADKQDIAPGMTMGPHGVYMGHVLLTDDAVGKRQLLLALVGHYLPEVWDQVCATAVRGPARIGLFDGRDALLAGLRAKLATLPNRAAVEARVTAEAELRDRAAAQAKAHEGPAALSTAGQADQALREAYLLSLPSRPAEFRAVWNHSGTGAWPGDWERSMRNLHDNGLNAILPNVAWGGYVLYDSEYLPHGAVVAQLGDQLAAAVAAGRQHGVEVHPWKVNWNLGNCPADFKAKMAADGRLQMDFNGNPEDWLEPSDPRNVELEANVMVEMARKYDVDGIHFDYIRYPGSDSGFSPQARERFERETGIHCDNWPADTRRPEIRPKWDQWRCDNISRLVQRVAEEVRRLKPHVKISAAVFSNYPNCKQDVGQDWIHWVQQGWVDFVCPMDYTGSDAGFGGMVARQMSFLNGRAPVYPGIGAFVLGNGDSSDRVAGQIDITRRLGADGFTIFNYETGLAEQTLPGLRLGPLASDATVDHNGPRYTFDVGETKLDTAFGRWLVPGAKVTVKVQRGQDPPGRAFGEIAAQVVLEDADGRQVRQLGAAPAEGKSVTVDASAPAGLYRVTVRGMAEAGGRKVPFAARSIPLVFGTPGMQF